MVKGNKRKRVSSSDLSKEKSKKIKAVGNDCTDGLTDEKEKGKGLGLEVRNNGVKRKKRKMKHSREEIAEVKDYFSEFPDHIIHHILGFLQSPKDAARTSVLSKKWKSIWDSFPAFDFDQRFFRPKAALKQGSRNGTKGSETANFVRVVNKSLATRLGTISSIQKFKLHLSAFNGVLIRPMNRWIWATLKKNVKELDIHVHDRRRHYRLPCEVLSSNTIASLKLYGIKLDKSTAIKLYNLRLLSIKNAHVEADLIDNFVNSCPLIEDLRLVYCKGLSCLHVSKLVKLNRVEVHECSRLEKVEIDAPNLQTFWFHGERDAQCKIDLTGCGGLKILTLKDSNITDGLFQDQISKFPNLEKLVLMDCNKLERITILSGKIKRLSLLRCWKLEEANIDAPHLVSFEYTGDKMPFSSMNILGLHELKLHFQPLKKKTYHSNLQTFLRKINQSEGFKLFLCSKQNAAIYEELRQIQLPSSCHNKLELTKSSKILRDLTDDCLLKICPKVLKVVSSSSSTFLQSMRELLLRRAKNPECCRYYSNKCWRHYLEEVKMSVSSGAPYETTFRLKWKPKSVAVE